MKKIENNVIKEVYCQKCGRQLEVRNGIITEGAISIEEKWGYFSNKDLQMHSFDLCEECYDKIVAEFAIPVEIKEYISVEDNLKQID